MQILLSPQSTGYSGKVQPYSLRHGECRIIKLTLRASISGVSLCVVIASPGPVPLGCWMLLTLDTVAGSHVSCLSRRLIYLPLYGSSSLLVGRWFLDTFCIVG